MQKTWPLQDARSNFSEVIDRAEGGEPQVVTRHGKEVAVVVSVEQYHQLMGKGKTLLEVLSGGPTLEGDEVDQLFGRKPGRYRKVKLP